MKKKDKVAFNYAEIFKGDLCLEDSVFLSLALIAWLKISAKTGEAALPPSLKLNQVQGHSRREVERRLEALAEHLGSKSFTEAARLWGSISLRSSTTALEKILFDEKNGLLADFDPSDLILQSRSSRNEFAFSPELADLVVEIAQPPRENGNVYLPWEQHGQLLGRVLARGNGASVECLTENPLLELIRSFYGGDQSTEIKSTNPIQHPSYSDPGSLHRFKNTIAFPPPIGKVQEDASKDDRFNRFPAATTSHNVLAIRHILAQTDGRAVVVVTAGFLSSAGAEKSLRKELVEKGVVEAVIALPAGQVTGAAVQVSVLVLNAAGGCEQIRMVDCATADFYESSGRTQRMLRVDEIACLARGQKNSQEVRIVDKSDVFQNDLSLAPARYMIAREQSIFDSILAVYECVPLEEVAEIIRTLPVSSFVNPASVLEVGAVDLTESGYLVPPTKMVNVERLNGRDDAQFLRPDDIVFVFKGSVGKVGICPPDTPPPGIQGWVVGQSMVILRCRDLGLTPVALVMLLRSSLGKSLVARVTAGAVQPFLSMNDLRKLIIPLPNQQQSRDIEGLFHQQADLQRQIQLLQRKLEKVHFSEWALPA